MSALYTKCIVKTVSEPKRLDHSLLTDDFLVSKPRIKKEQPLDNIKKSKKALRLARAV